MTEKFRRGKVQEGGVRAGERREERETVTTFEVSEVDRGEDSSCCASLDHLFYSASHITPQSDCSS